MPEVSIQHLATNQSGIEPSLGDLLYGELMVNTAEGRLWTGDEFGVPIEIGGAVKNHPIGDELSSNYVVLSLETTEDLPIRTIDPLSVLPGFYTKVLYLIEVKSESLSITFDHLINWGTNWGIDLDPSDPQASDPLNKFKSLGRKFIIELSTFGQSPELIGRVLWIN